MDWILTRTFGWRNKMARAKSERLQNGPALGLLQFGGTVGLLETEGGVAQMKSIRQDMEQKGTRDKAIIVPFSQQQDVQNLRLFCHQFYQ